MVSLLDDGISDHEATGASSVSRIESGFKEDYALRRLRSCRIFDRMELLKQNFVGKEVS